jgi:hypothetical protein
MDATTKHRNESHHIPSLAETGNATPPCLPPFGVRSGAIGVAIKTQNDLKRTARAEEQRGEYLNWQITELIEGLSKGKLLYSTTTTN